jgi:hypothetical protein
MRVAAYACWAIAVLSGLVALMFSADENILLGSGAYLYRLTYNQDVARLGVFCLLLSPTALICGTVLYVGSRLEAARRG